MPKSCIICSAGASPELQLQYCAACQSALYCSRTCQRKDWKKQHKQICKLLNVGHGDTQTRTDNHTSRSIRLKKRFECSEGCLDKDEKQFFKLFKESTLDGSRAAAPKMNKYAKRQDKYIRRYLMFHSLDVLVRSSNSEMLSWPNSPLLVLLQFVDPSLLDGDEVTKGTPLHFLATLADSFDYPTHEKLLILAKQLVEHGANVNIVSIPQSLTHLHVAS